MTYERGQRGRLDALAGDVAEQHDPAVAVLVEVVEVASDLDLLGGASGAVERGDVPSLDRRDRVGEEAPLERVRGLTARGGEP